MSSTSDEPQIDLFFPETSLDDDIGVLERRCYDRGYRCLVGVDEAGRGPLAGPVHAAAVVLSPDTLEADWIAELDDSKKLTESRREDLFARICDEARAWAICSRDEPVIAEINILQAALAAMEEAVAEVCRELDGPPDWVLVDGNRPITCEYPQRTLVKGDGRSLHIAAASILAKVERDRLMVEYHERWPQYGFDSHKGYGSAAHREAIAEHGPCPIHRRTFRGVREHLPDDANSPC
jgi:ribonuclease HII